LAITILLAHVVLLGKALIASRPNRSMAEKLHSGKAT
jgi:hypothetical protein